MMRAANGKMAKPRNCIPIAMAFWWRMENGT